MPARIRRAMPATVQTASANSSTGTLSSILVSDGSVYGGISATMASSSIADSSAPSSAAGERDDQALGEQLPDDGAAGGAHRGPHGQLALARAAARQQQVGDVGAGDQQQEPDGSQQQPQPLLGRVADEVVAEGLDTDGPPGFGRRALALDRRAEGHHARVRLGDGDAVFQPAHHVEPVVPAFQLLGREGQRQPQLVLLVIGGTFAQHADDGVRLAVEPHRAPKDAAVAGKAVLPDRYVRTTTLSRPTTPSSSVNVRPNASG